MSLNRADKALLIAMLSVGLATSGVSLAAGLPDVAFYVTGDSRLAAPREQPTLRQGILQLREKRQAEWKREFAELGRLLQQR